MHQYNILVTILHEIVATHLRHVFKREWDHYYPSMPWKDDDDTSLENFIRLEQGKGKQKKSRTILKNTSDRNAWDLTALFHALLFSDSIGQKLKHLPQNTYPAIYKLKQSRNALSHVQPSTYKTTAKYQQQYDEIEKCLQDLGFPDVHEDMEDVVKHYSHQGEVESCCRIDLSNKWLGLKQCMMQLTFRQFLIFFFALVISSLMIYSIATNQTCEHNVVHKQDAYVNETRSIRKKSNLLNTSAFYFPDFMKPCLFVGREHEVTEITHYLLDKETNLVNIFGPPALGKTTLAVAVGQHLQQKYGYHVGFANIHRDSFSSAIDIICLSIGYQGCENIFLQEGNKNYTPKVLMIIDDIDIALESYEPEFKSFIIKMIDIFRITILTTSKKEWLGNNDGFVTFKIMPLCYYGSSQMLKEICPEITEIDIDHIAVVTQGVPLLLEIIGHQMKAGLSPEKLLEIKTGHRPAWHQMALKPTYPPFKTDTVDPNNATTFFPLLEKILYEANMNVHFVQMPFVNYGLDMYINNANSKRHFNLELANLGLNELNTTCNTHDVMIKMHSVLKEFVLHLAINHNYLLQLCEFLPIEPLPIVLGVALMVNILGKILIFWGGKDVIHPTVMQIGIYYVVFFILEFFCFSYTGRQRIVDIGLICLLSLIISVSQGKIRLKRCRGIKSLRTVIGISLHWLFCCAFLALVCYISYIILFYVTHSEKRIRLNNIITAKDMNPMTQHLIVCCLLGLGVLLTLIEIDPSLNNRILSTSSNDTDVHLSKWLLHLANDCIRLYIFSAIVCSTVVYFLKNNAFLGIQFVSILKILESSQLYHIIFFLILAYETKDHSSEIQFYKDLSREDRFKCEFSVLLVMHTSVLSLTYIISYYAELKESYHNALALHSIYFLILVLYLLFTLLRENSIHITILFKFTDCLEIYTFLIYYRHIFYMISGYVENGPPIPSIDTKSLHYICCFASLTSKFGQCNGILCYLSILVPYHILYLLCPSFFADIERTILEFISLPLCFTCLHFLDVSIISEDINFKKATLCNWLKHFVIILTFFYLLHYPYLYFTGDHLLLITTDDSMIYTPLPLVLFCFGLTALILLSVGPIGTSNMEEILAMARVFVLSIVSYYLAYISDALYANLMYLLKLF